MTDTLVATVAPRSVLSKQQIMLSKDIHDNTFLDWVPVAKMFTDIYCRPLIGPHMSDIKEAWDDGAVGVLMVSYRDGIDMYAILDGNHRAAAARSLGISQLPCRVYIDLTLEQEAEKYKQFGQVRKQNPIDKFRARLVMKEPSSLAIERILQKHNLEIPTHGGPGTGKVRAVAILDRLYAQHGPDALDWIIGTTHKVWEGDQAAYATWALQGMEAFWMRHAHLPTFRYNHFIQRLKKTGVRALQQKANNMKLAMSTAQSIRNAWGRSMWEIYNYKLSADHRLPEWSDYVWTPGGRKKISDAAAKSARDRARKKKGGH